MVVHIDLNLLFMTKHPAVLQALLSRYSYLTARVGNLNRTPARLKMNPNPAIPLIDFDQFLNGSIDDRKDVATAIDTAFRSVGFFYLRNHGIDEDKVDECFLWVSLRTASSDCNDWSFVFLLAFMVAFPRHLWLLKG